MATRISSRKLSTSAVPPRATGQAPRAPRQLPIRYAVVGLGHIAQAAVLPAFKHARRNSRLAALVSDDPAKLRALGRRYDIGALYDYRGFRRCLTEESIDAVYIATPNSEHRRFVMEAAACSAHILCEKPLGVTERECVDMISACAKAKVRLMTAYRLHFEAANLAAVEAIRSGRIGRPRIFTSVFSYQIKDPLNIRLRADLGGGPLHDIGIYCINAARSVFRSEPTQVHAWASRGGDKRFREVDEMVTGMMRFGNDQIATFTCSFGAAASGWYQVVGTKGDISLDPAFEYAEGLTIHATADEKTRTRRFAKRDQFAAELLYFSDCLREGVDPQPSGLEGLADVRIIAALERSLSRNRPVEVRPTSGLRYPSPHQRIDRPAVVREPKLIRARAAST